jgi:hypothetical protein
LLSANIAKFLPRSRCGSVTTRLCPPLAAIHYRVAASLPFKNFQKIIFINLFESFWSSKNLANFAAGEFAPEQSEDVFKKVLGGVQG